MNSFIHLGEKITMPFEVLLKDIKFTHQGSVVTALWITPAGEEFKHKEYDTHKLTPTVKKMIQEHILRFAEKIRRKSPSDFKRVFGR